MLKQFIKYGVLIFLLALIIRLIVLIFLLTNVGSNGIILGDTTRYLALAQSLVNGQGYFYDGSLEAFRPPGYPAYLFLFVYFNIPLWLAAIIQIIFSSLI